MFRKICGDKALPNALLVTNMWGAVRFYEGQQREDELKRSNLFFKPALEKGAKTTQHHGDRGSAERIIRSLLNNHPLPLLMQEELHQGKGLINTSAAMELNRELHDQMEEHEEEARELTEQKEQAKNRKYERVKKALKARMQSKEESMRKELEEEKRRARKEADGFRKCIAELQSKEESMRKELEEEKRRARKEADGFRKCIAELQSKLEEGRHGYGKTSATYNFQCIPANLGVFLVGPLAHLALQRVYPSTDLHPNSPIDSTTRFTARSMNNGCKTFRRMTSSGSLTIWIRHVPPQSFLTGCSSWPVGSRHSRSFRSRFAKVLTRTRKHMHDSYDAPNILQNSLPPSNR